MSAQLYLFRPYKTVRDLGLRNGINPSRYINAIRNAQEHGNDGQNIAGEFRVHCWERENGYLPDPKGAA